jgi:hypothetical protein
MKLKYRGIMIEILNKMPQRIIINLKSGKHIDLLSKGTAVISEDDLNSSQLQNLFAKEKVIISSKEEETKKKRKYEHKIKIEPEVSGTEDTSESVVEESKEKSEHKENIQEQSEGVPEELPEKPEPKKDYKRKSK